MSRVPTSIAVLALIAGLISTVSAQTKPSFAGNWTLVPPAGAPPPPLPPGIGLGQGGTIEQTARTITVTTTTQAGEMKLVYNLDGTETRNPLVLGDTVIDRASKVKWDGARLVITNTTDVNGTVSQSTQTWSLDASGTLTIETSARDFSGNPTTRKQTYKKG